MDGSKSPDLCPYRSLLGRWNPIDVSTDSPFLWCLPLVLSDSLRLTYPLLFLLMMQHVMIHNRVRLRGIHIFWFCIFVIFIWDWYKYCSVLLFRTLYQMLLHLAFLIKYLGMLLFLQQLLGWQRQVAYPYFLITSSVIRHDDTNLSNSVNMKSYGIDFYRDPYYSTVLMLVFPNDI